MLFVDIVGVEMEGIDSTLLLLLEIGYDRARVLTVHHITVIPLSVKWFKPSSVKL